MNTRERLLLEPPQAFRDLAMWMHQDVHYEITPERGVEGYLADHVHGKDVTIVLAYLDAVLSRDDIDNGDLKGLLKKSLGFGPQGKQARQLIEAFRDNLRIKADKDA